MTLKATENRKKEEKKNQITHSHQLAESNISIECDNTILEIYFYYQCTN